MLWLMGGAAVVNAQTPSPAGSLAPGSEVKAEIRVREGTETVRGLVVSATPEGLGLRSFSDETVWVEASSLARLEVKRGRTAGAGASRGWKIGAVTLGLPLGLLVAGEADSPGVGFLYGAVAGGVAGSLVGALVGAAIGADSWERVWCS
jgi:hypothetical protein